MTKVDENIQTAQNMLSWIIERCYELEEENRKLKEEIKAEKKLSKIKSGHILELKQENEKLKEKIKDYIEQIEYDKETIQELVDMGIKAIDGRGEAQEKAKKLERELSILKEKYGDIDL